MLRCKVCGEPAEPMYLCRKHFACEVCGSKDNLVIRNAGVTCDTCHEKIENLLRDAISTPNIR